MQNPVATSDVRLMNADLMRGKYQFNFPEQANTLRKKIFRVAVEPTAFQLYKRGDYNSKIDVIPNSRMRLAKLFFKLMKHANKDRQLQANKLDRLRRNMIKNNEVEENLNSHRRSSYSPRCNSRGGQATADDSLVPDLERTRPTTQS